MVRTLDDAYRSQRSMAKVRDAPPRSDQPTLPGITP
jgi:hypothetical protein